MGAHRSRTGGSHSRLTLQAASWHADLEVRLGALAEVRKTGEHDGFAEIALFFSTHVFLFPDPNAGNGSLLRGESPTKKA